MAIASELVVLDSQDQPAAMCVVCGNDIAAGQGVTASYSGRILRSKCPGGFSRLPADRDRFLSGQIGGCCGGAHDHSPASEWA